MSLPAEKCFFFTLICGEIVVFAARAGHNPPLQIGFIDTLKDGNSVLLVSKVE